MTTATLTELFAGCLADPDCKAGWLVLTDCILEALEADGRVTASAGGRSLKVENWGGTRLVMTTVDGSGALVGLKEIPVWLRKMSKAA